MINNNKNQCKQRYFFAVCSLACLFVCLFVCLDLFLFGLFVYLIQSSSSNPKNKQVIAVFGTRKGISVFDCTTSAGVSKWTSSGSSSMGIGSAGSQAHRSAWYIF